MGVESFHHRPTLKQTNKPFKSKHSSKSSQKDRAKGRVARLSVKSASPQNASAQLRKNRKNAAKQVQMKKRHALVSATRIFSGVDGAPRVVAVVPLSEDVSSQAASAALADSLDVDSKPSSEFGLWKLKADRFKTSLQFIHLPYRHLYATLDACKVADYVVFVLSPTVEVNTWGDMLLRALQAQGLPHIVACVTPGSSPEDAKNRKEITKSLLSFMQYFVPSLSRVFDLAASSERANALRTLCEGHPTDVKWRSGRAWLLAEDVRWESMDNSDEGDGRLHVTGVVRGAQFSANRLVHLPGYGDYQVEKILSAPLPRSGRVVEMDVEPALFAEPNSEDADSLVSTNVPDDLVNEQTWPTEEEMEGATTRDTEQIPDAKKGTTPRRVKRVPKGWSEYQAAWIVEDEDDDVDDEGEDVGDDGDLDMNDGNTAEHEKEVQVEEDEDEDEMVELPNSEPDISSRRDVAFEDLDMEEETRQLDAWRSRDRAKDEAEDAAFPDEIDTPMDVPARDRFQRYRGLRSFRTSPWDPYENLPRDYARIFQFEDFRLTERNVRRRTEADGYGIGPGTRVTVTLRGVPEEASKIDPVHPMVVFSLLQHEHKVSVLNFTIQRNTEYDAPVRSKVKPDTLILCYGPRRLHTNPVYSQQTRGGGKGVNNVHKFERWLRHGVTSVATTYGPVAFGNQPCMLLRETSDPQAPELVAMGSFLDTDTTRIVAKRITLTGHPFKVHRKTATVRYMLFDPEDVEYFKPIQLHTKYGRIGHIKEPLGTHGYFKAHFDGSVTQMDTVCMSLYKRIYPRWSTLWRNDRKDYSIDRDGDDHAMEE